MSTNGRTLECPAIHGTVRVITLLERKHMGLPAVRTFLSCSGMGRCITETGEPISLHCTPEACPLRLSLE